MQNKMPKSGQMFPKNQERVSQAIHLFPKKTPDVSQKNLGVSQILELCKQVFYHNLNNPK